MLVVHNSPGNTENPILEPITTLQELPDNVLGGSDCLAARFRMAGHYPLVLALADYAFRWAAKKDSEDLMRYVLERGAPVDINALLSSVEVKDNREAIALLKAKRAATEPLYSFANPLHTACFYGQLGVAVSLLNGGRTRNLSKILCSSDYRGETALHKAVGGRGAWKDGERMELVRTLLSLGADPIQKDMRGRTPFDLANIWHLKEMIPALGAAIQRKLESPPKLWNI